MNKTLIINKKDNVAVALKDLHLGEVYNGVTLLSDIPCGHKFALCDIKENENLSILNHSCAHLLAQAVKHLYPDAKFWVGPVIEDGFYYDIDLGDKVLTEDDLEKIEKEMKKC